MARIPEAQRQTFASGIERPQLGADLAAIDRVAAPAQAIAQTGKKVTNVLAKARLQQVAAEGAEYNSQLNLQFQQRFSQAVKSPEVQKNPALARNVVNRIADDLINTQEFKDKPGLVQTFARRSMAGLRTQYNMKAINFENAQAFNNVITSLNKTQDNFELQALDSDTDLNDLLRRYTASVSANVKSGALSINQGEAQILAGAKTITANRFQRFINQKDLAGAQAFISDDVVKEHLGADGLNSAIQTIERKRRLNASMSNKLARQSITNPWKYVGSVDSESTPPISLSDPADLSESLDNRLGYVNRKNQQYNIKLPILNEEEELAITNVLEKTPAKEATTLLNQLTSNMTDEQQSLIGQQIFKKNNAFGVAIAIADDDPVTARDVLNGAKVIKGKSVVMPPNSQITGYVNDYLSNSIQQPQYRQAIVQGVKNLYADEIFKNNDTTGAASKTKVVDMAKRLLGDQIEINDGLTFGFRKNDGNFIEEDDFLDAFDDLNERELQKQMGDVPRDINGQPLPIDELKEYAQLMLVGDGKYLIQLLDEYAVDKKGRPYILDMKKIYEANPRQSKGFFNALGF